jgi:malate/lactate dehydrogenase
MLSTATALIQATEESIFDEEVMGFAQAFCHHREQLDEEQFAKSIYAYSCMLASLAIDKAMKVLLDENQIRELCESIDELEKMRDEVINDGK